MDREFFAHSRAGAPTESWQPLPAHLENVARLARRFAESFGAGDWGYLAGLWHDVGKFSRAFQQYLRQADGDYHRGEIELAPPGEPAGTTVDHSTAGAQHAVETEEVLGHLLANAIAGHHAGLLDTIADGACLRSRLEKEVEPWSHGLPLLPPAPRPKLPPHLLRRLEERGSQRVRAGFAFAFFTRMLFSCLVDADYLDTEEFLDPGRARGRPRWPEDILVRMEEALDQHVARFPRDDTPVDRERHRVRQACLEAASRDPGFFSLTVPTGGGKTLSSLAFALRHARLHGLRRIVYVIPFTSIIEQNAEVFRRVFAPLVAAGLPDPVLEHHSALDAGRETLANRLAAENWDAPLVVTTSVQFYESLFSHRTSRCRKLHNLSRAVVILDEAQKLPVEHLAPCLAALGELVEGYGSSVVLCTATQPAIHLREEFPIGIEGVREIIPDPPALYERLKRVDVVPLRVLADEALVDRLAGHEQVLCIVNTRRHARDLWTRLVEKTESPEGVFHLSAAMCPEHRTVVLDEIRSCLTEGRPCRVISTQLVEAGVDVDFPVVYRSLAGLDSIAQAAGRCNRNGRLERGRTFVFEPENAAEGAFLQGEKNATREILGNASQRPLYDDLLSLDAIEHFFRLYYWNAKPGGGWDREDVLAKFQLVPTNRRLPFCFDFRVVGTSFRLIDESGEAVIVPWGEAGEDACRRLRAIAPPHPRELLRRIQRLTVTVHRRSFRAALGTAVELVHDRYPVLVSTDTHYDPYLGLVLEGKELDSTTLVI